MKDSNDKIIGKIALQEMNRVQSISGKVHYANL